MMFENCMMCGIVPVKHRYTPGQPNYYLKIWGKITQYILYERECWVIFSQPAVKPQLWWRRFLRRVTRPGLEIQTQIPDAFCNKQTDATWNATQLLGCCMPLPRAKVYRKHDLGLEEQFEEGCSRLAAQDKPDIKEVARDVD